MTIQIPIKFRTELQELKYEIQSNPNCKCRYCKYVDSRPWNNPVNVEKKKIYNQRKIELT